MQERKEFRTESWVSGGQWSEELFGRAFNAIGGKFSATLDTGAAAITNVFTDPACKLMGTSAWELNQGETPLMRLRPQLLMLLSWYVQGQPLQYVQPATLGATSTDVAFFTWFLDFVKMAGPMALVDARQEKVFTRGTFGTSAQYTDAASLDAFSGDLRQWVRSTDRLPRVGGGEYAYLRPHFYEVDIDVSNSSTDVAHVIRFDQDLVVPFLLLVTRDNDKGGGTAVATGQPFASRTDGLVKSIRAEIATAGQSGEIARGSWGALKSDTWNRCAYGGHVASSVAGALGDPQTVVPTGVVALDLIDENRPELHGARVFQRGESITLHLDTASDVEREFTSVSPATGDQVHVVIPAFAPVRVGALADTPGSTRVANATRRSAELVRRRLGR